MILGGGAAGLMCAIEAGKRGRRVAILEHADRIGKKILISGGGRCNFTNLYCAPENFLSSNPHFAKSALARYTPADFIALIEKHKIPYHEKTLGQLFCDRSARDVVSMLEAECREAKVDIFLNSKIQQVEHSGEFLVRTSIRDSVAEFRAPALMVATGGLSIPKMGASSFGYEMARQFGLAIRETRPALVPLILPPDERSRFCDLAGVSTEVIASFGEHRFHEKMLITHRGLSGPAILQISSYWKKPEPILLDLAPGRSVTTAFHDPKMARNSTAIKTLMHSILPHRLSERWVDSYPPKAWTTAALDEWEDRLHRWPILPSGTEGYEKAEVTAGGVDPDELSAKSMESRKVPGLFFIGEVVDVTGQLGGFNFQWAWSSGAAAGRAL